MRRTQKYLCTEPTKDARASYYKSCICGEKGTETFFYGEPLRKYTEQEKLAYQPTSLTVTLYDTASSTYGFTYNTEKEPLRPVVQIQKGNALTTEAKEYEVSVSQEKSYTTSGQALQYYISKAEVDLEPSCIYTYRIYDKYVDVGTETVTFETKNTTSSSFTFTHVSDSQMKTSTGAYFANVLAQTTKSDFIVHTGDVVEQSKYESEWKDMLHDNFAYLSKIPMMAISGNHETTYLAGSNETFKHFHNKIPEQASTKLGYFYSFVYGNTKFIMLNTNDLTENKLKPEQYDWLVRELQNNTSDWTIVAMHNPMYSVGKYGVDSSRNVIALTLRAQLQKIFADYGVDVVLQGHDHTISRTYPINGNGQAQNETWETVDGVTYSVNPNGVLYVMNGPAGTQGRAPVSVDSSLYYYAQTSKQYSWADFEINGKTMKITVKHYDGTNVNVYQTWGIKKTTN